MKGSPYLQRGPYIYCKYVPKTGGSHFPVTPVQSRTCADSVYHVPGPLSQFNRGAWER